MSCTKEPCKYCHCENKRTYFNLCVFNYGHKEAIAMFLQEITKAENHLSICYYRVIENAVFIEGWCDGGMKEVFFEPPHEDNLFWYCEEHAVWVDLWGRDSAKKIEEHFVISEDGVCLSHESKPYEGYELLDSYEEFCAQSFDPNVCEDPITETLPKEEWKKLKKTESPGNTGVILGGLGPWYFNVGFPCSLFHVSKDKRFEF